MTSEALARKERSIAILKEQNVPYIDHLPVIETESESTRRTTEEVALRAIALSLVAVKGGGLEQEKVEKLIREYDAAWAFTLKEKEFINNQNPSQHDRVQFSWRYEDYWVMLWALGYIDELERPDEVCDVKRAVSILGNRGREGFVKDAKLRPQAEILDAADLIYRYHWATTEARLRADSETSGLDDGVVYERHHALNWLIGYMDQEWDDISTDT